MNFYVMYEARLVNFEIEEFLCYPSDVFQKLLQSGACQWFLDANPVSLEVITSLDLK